MRRRVVLKPHERAAIEMKLARWEPVAAVIDRARAGGVWSGAYVQARKLLAALEWREVYPTRAWVDPVRDDAVEGFNALYDLTPGSLTARIAAALALDDSVPTRPKPKPRPSRLALLRAWWAEISA